MCAHHCRVRQPSKYGLLLDVRQVDRKFELISSFFDGDIAQANVADLTFFQKKSAKFC